ncbi:Dot/Icm T4SS effector [Legionella rubrilucens]|uniref:Dot/Icm T4SS effector n=1 Tax=Legionella rubrilucens TaxID=458 RepID=A0A0W0XLY0_9GAMM|nr:hypothetical protein [Legionella rubrilucens]KTD45534.1 Dot/Icm T4SS effector [Legionella rubrilucens]
MAKVVYHSLDFDGCFSNEASSHALGKQWTASKSNQETNQAYLAANAAILTTFAKGDETILLVGSNRQNPHIDFKNGTGTEYPPGSVFPRMEAFADQVGGTFNPFLLTDLETAKPDIGSTYRRFKEKDYLQENGSYKDKVDPRQLESDGFSLQKDDESKVSLLYAQMQLAAMNHPHDVIEFNFYDDRKDIAEPLFTFFQKNPELIPKNVTLNVIGYSGPALTREQVQESLTHFIMHTTSDPGSTRTLDVLKDAEKNNFPVLIKIPGEEDTFNLYRRNEDGEWGFEAFDGVIEGLDPSTLSGKFPKEGERTYPNTAKEPEIFSYLKNHHFVPIPSTRRSSKPVYDYGEPKRFTPVQGEGSIPTEVADWLPAYHSLRDTAKVSEMDDYKISVAEGFDLTAFIARLPSPETGILSDKSREYIDLMIEKKRFQLQGELTAEERNALESSLIELYKVRINSDNKQLLSQSIGTVEVRDARNELCTAVTDALESPELTLEDCQNMDNILHHSNKAIDPTQTTETQLNSLCELGTLSDKVGSKTSAKLAAVSAACGLFAVVAAIAAIALAPTGIGLAIGFAVAGALAAASIGTGIGAQITETNLADKTRNFKDALQDIREPSEEEPSLNQGYIRV